MAMLTTDVAAIVTEEEAIAAGYTDAVIADCSMYTLELLIKPGADLDGSFAAFNRNEREMLTVNGWLFDISPD
ncbi:hypothetical protein [Novosphingobium sp. HII-3]|uniref:hypothetical protein n=1 Tax=Novosphingobium sp. HII-3 TaxID=2075565 RepID=UPI000CDB355C|nr:hypothetical protein [Novosphingobium sp. HII-3]